MDFIDALLFDSFAYGGVGKHVNRKLRDYDRHMRRRLRREHATSAQRIDDLERALARVTMLARAMAELGLSKGAFTREELEAALLQADLADGQTTGGLDPDLALPGEERAADLEPLDDDE